MPLGEILNGTFPPNDGRTYFYKRNNGHLYLYRNGNEQHICCDDGLINRTPIITNFTVDGNGVHQPITDTLHLPDATHTMLFMFEDSLWGLYSNGDKKQITPNWNQNQW